MLKPSGIGHSFALNFLSSTIECFQGESVRWQLQQETFMVSILNFLEPNQGVAYTIFTGGKVVGIATKIAIPKKKKGRKKGKNAKMEKIDIIVTRFFK